MLIGVSTSAYQNEGYNIYSDWWLYEKLGKYPPSGSACDSYRRFYDDIQLLQQLGVNAYRFSIEFARIMPEKNKINKQAIEHYKTLVSILKREEIEPIVTLWHYTLPIWLAKEGGLESKKVYAYFMDYVKTLVYNEVLEGVKYILTINEPSVYATLGYLLGIYPPRKHGISNYLRASNTLINLHNIMYEFLKEQGYSVSFAHSMTNYKSAVLIDYPIVWLLEWFNDYRFLDFMKKDYIAINYYGSVYPAEVLGPRGVNENVVLPVHEDPKGLESVIKRAYNRYHLPIIITENGISTNNEKRRAKFIKNHVEVVKNLAEDYKIFGYFYWTLMDNYEWIYGYKKHFGLFTRDRKPKASVEAFKKAAELLKSI
jgi:beta-glucosidase